jgi:hypothetical protein
MIDEIKKIQKSHAIIGYKTFHCLTYLSLWQYIQTFDTETRRKKKTGCFKFFNFHTFEYPNLAKSSSNYRNAMNATAKKINK